MCAVSYTGIMLYTGNGDDGTTRLFSDKNNKQTRTFGCDQRISKSSRVAEALGAVDEVNSLLGVVKMKGKDVVVVDGVSFDAIIDDIQQDLFVVQAELAGADKHIDLPRVRKVEELVDDIEKELPPIKTFFVPGGTELGAFCDYVRTVARRAERRVVEVVKENKKWNDHLLAYMNRLSSLLYALARLANHHAGVHEEKPHY